MLFHSRTQADACGVYIVLLLVTCASLDSGSRAKTLVEWGWFSHIPLLNIKVSLAFCMDFLFFFTDNSLPKSMNEVSAAWLQVRDIIKP